VGDHERDWEEDEEAVDWNYKEWSLKRYCVVKVKRLDIVKAEKIVPREVDEREEQNNEDVKDSMMSAILSWKWMKVEYDLRRRTGIWKMASEFYENSKMMKICWKETTEKDKRNLRQIRAF